MCKNLVEKGNLDKPLIIFNRTKKRSDELAAKIESDIGSGKTKVVDTINDAVKESDIILMCLGDDAAVNEAVDTMLQEDVKGKLIVDCSTVHPDTTNALEKKITGKGAEFVGMPGKLHPHIHLRTAIMTLRKSSAHPLWPTQANSSA
jgi:3-hydroxyisobutyrate dehydrogenase-like beta-hydroxyacid dehydrogenase